MEQGLKRMAVAVLAMVLVMVAPAGCGGTASTTPASQAEAYVSSHLDTSYEGALPAANQLALGTILLEGTAHAVTPGQAQALLPLWQSLQSGSLQGQAEVNAVLGQIERTMTTEQLSAIAAMRLTQDDLVAWAQEQGFSMGQGPAGMGAPPSGGWPGDISPQARETMRAEFESMSDEERAQRMAERQATAEAGGLPAGGWTGRGPRAGAGLGQVGFLLRPLIELLIQRASS